MKKLIISLMAICVIIFSATIVGAADVEVYVNGNPVAFETLPEITDERTMVPMRAIFEKLGAEVMWDGDTQTVTARKGDIVVVTTIGNNVMTVNGEEKEMDIAPYIKDDNTLVPVRFVSEALNCSVTWDGENSRVNIIEYPTENYTAVYDTVSSYIKEYGTFDEANGYYLIESLVNDVMIELIYNEEDEFVFVKSGFYVEEDYCDSYLQLWKDGYRETSIRVIYDGETGILTRSYMGERIVLNENVGDFSIDSFLEIGDAMYMNLDGIIQSINPECSFANIGIVY